MLLSSFLLLFVLGLTLLAVAAAAAEYLAPDWIGAAAGMAAAVLFGVLAISAQNIERVADDGSVSTHAEPVLGLVALGLAAAALVVTALILIDWLPKPSDFGGRSSGY